MTKSEIPRTDYPTQLDKWEDFAPIPLAVEGTDGPILDLAQSFWESRKGTIPDEQSPGLSLSNIIRGSREIVFDIEEDASPTLHFVMYCLSSDDIALTLQPLIQSVDLDEDGVLKHLALARIYEVPVVPNREEVAPVLAQYHRRMLTEGFKLNDDSPKYTLTERIDPNADVMGLVEHLGSLKQLVPAEAELIRQRLKQELTELGQAKALVSGLDNAIARLEYCLAYETANEAELQRCLTDNPVLLGVDYKLIKPKHRLGAEYEMDYALIRWSGQIDLVEIEASTRRLFNKKLDPSADLVHAEQQVLDWLQWVERNHAYAREGLPGLVRPTGYIVIGRDTTLTQDARQRLSFRNRVFGNSVVILTYDALLERAKTMRVALTETCRSPEGG